MSDIHRAVADLLERQRIRLQRDDTGRTEWQTIPSLWEQLESSAMWTGSGTGGGTFGSRPVISTDVVSLIIDIAQATAEAANDIAGGNRGTAPDNIRAIAANLTDGHDPDQLTWWTDKITEWVHTARAALHLDPPRPRWARGVRCPDCGADTARANLDGESMRTPALAITWSGPDRDDRHHSDAEWKVRAVECHQCGTVWWRGPDLDALVDQMLANNLTRETMCDTPGA